MPQRLEHEVDARGSAYVILALDLAPFVKPQCRERLELLRGTHVFDEFLESLQLQDPRFERDGRYQDLEQQGYELGIFNQILTQDNFAPTYRLCKDSVVFPSHLRDNLQFKNRFLPVWDKWSFWLRLSSNGVVTIVMKRDFSERRALVHISRDVLGLQEFFDMDSARAKLAELQDGLTEPEEEIEAKIDSVREFMEWVSEHSLHGTEQERPAVVWQMAVEVIRQFIEACHGHLCSDGDSRPRDFDLELTADIERNEPESVRERYTVFNFYEMTHFSHKEKKHRILPPVEVLTDQGYARLASCLLEGVILEQVGEGGRSKAHFYPVHSSTYADGLARLDCSTWEDEFCILTERSAIIYCRPREQNRAIFPSRRIQYADYWESLIRGIEFGVETKVLVQLAEQATASYLGEALPLLRGDQRLNQKHLQRVDACAANAARLIAHLRTITAPHLIAQASYAVDKFDLLIKQAGIPQILEHAEANLADLTSLLQRNHDLLLQIESQRMNELALAISVIFTGLTLSLGILALPSFIADWEQQSRGYLSNRSYYPYLSWVGEILVISLALVGTLALVWSGINFVRVRRRRKPHIL
jgi:hypothetical protein